MRTALFQMNIIWENKAQNLDKLRLCLDLLQDKNVEILFLPEMSLTGFSMNTDVTAEKDDYTLEKIREFASRYGIGIGVGWTKKGEDSLCENHYTIVSGDVAPEDGGAGRNGLIESDYIKIHPFGYDNEDKYFRGGDNLSVFRFSDFSIGTAICYDLRFGEIFTKLSERADLIVVPANWPASRVMHWDTLLRARAIENQCYIAGINCAGMMNAKNYSGHSVIFNPVGEMIRPTMILDINNNIIDVNSYNGESEDAILIYDLSNDVQKIRTDFPVKNDRKPDLYNTL
ncbi:MAG: carbon-nitrogen family hydrolase [Lachnospiraceae bacterium]|nr:carbon-nitrogen family hydrolase [Lachnospiraceae bacterium]